MLEVGILSEDDRVELIHGEIIQMSPSKSLHAARVNLLARALILLAEKDWYISIQNPVKLSNYSEPEPDIAVCRYQKDCYINAHPEPGDLLLLIEVSDSTIRKDREVKAPLYALANIPEYWIVNVIDEEIEVYRQPGDGRYTQRERYGYDAKIPLPQGRTLDMAEVF